MSRSKEISQTQDTTGEGRLQGEKLNIANHRNKALDLPTFNPLEATEGILLKAAGVFLQLKHPGMQDTVIIAHLLNKSENYVRSAMADVTYIGGANWKIIEKAIGYKIFELWLIALDGEGQ